MLPAICAAGHGNGKGCHSTVSDVIGDIESESVVPRDGCASNKIAQSFVSIGDADAGSGGAERGRKAVCCSSADVLEAHAIACAVTIFGTIIVAVTVLSVLHNHVRSGTGNLLHFANIGDSVVSSDGESIGNATGRHIIQRQTDAATATGKSTGIDLIVVGQ